MPKQIYNEGRVVGLSAYESYVRRKLADDENAQVASEREWLASTLGMGASLLLHVDANTQMTVPSSSYSGLRYCDFPFPKSSKLGAASTIIMSFFDGTGDFNLQDAIINASTARSLSGKQVVLTNSPILKRKTSLTLKFTNPSAGSITIDDSKSIDGELSSENFVRCTGIISTNPYNARFDTLVTLPNLVIDSGLAAIKGEQFKLYGANNTVLFYDDGSGHLISEADGSVVATTVYNDDGVTIKSFTNIQPDYSSIGIYGISYNTYLDIYISGKLDFTTRKITISVDSRSTDIKYADYGVTFSASSATLVSNNITSGNVSVAYSYYTYETNTLWADRVTSYGRLLNNSTSSASPSTPGDTKSRTPIGSLVPLTKYVALTSSNIASLVGGDWTNGPTNWATEYNTKYYTRSGSSPNYTYAQNTKSSWATAKSQTLYVYQVEDELKQMMDYLKIADAIIIQPGEWAHNDEIASPYKDFKPGDYIHNPAILRIYFTNEIKNSFNILLTGFIDKDVVVGESDLTSAIDTASPENGDFLGPAAYPWAAKIIVTTPTELSYYLKNSIRSGSQNVIITQSDDSPEVSIAVKNTIDRGTKEQIEGDVKHSDNTDSQLPAGYAGKNVHVGQSDDLYPEDTKIGVKNVITSNKSYLSVTQTNDGAETLLDVDAGELVGDGITYGTGIYIEKSGSKQLVRSRLLAGTGVVIDPVSGTAQSAQTLSVLLAKGNGIDITKFGNAWMITNTLPNYDAGTWQRVDESCFDEYWYNSFYCGPATGYRDSIPDDRGKLQVYLQVSTDDNHSNVYGGAIKITTDVSDNKCIKHAGKINSVTTRHANPWYQYYLDSSGIVTETMYDSWITRIKFKAGKVFSTSGNELIDDGRKLNKLKSYSNTTPQASGIWNLHKLTDSGYSVCGASWHANCPLTQITDTVSVPHYVGYSLTDSQQVLTNLSDGDGLLLSISQYADGYNAQLGTSVGGINLYTYKNINLYASCTFKGTRYTG